MHARYDDDDNDDDDDDDDDNDNDDECTWKLKKFLYY
jgi:hypothetical protein